MLTHDITAQKRIDALLAQMTLAEKIGQMTQAECKKITPQEISEFAIGSVLSGGGSNPVPNNSQSWRSMVGEFIEASLKTRLQIPLIYGVDAVHGHNNCHGAVIFPHNIGLGATRNAQLVEDIGKATAKEMLATNVQWNFSPCLAIVQDPRWGRTYESYGNDIALVGELGAAYTRGLQSEGVAACIKHFVADGGAEWNTRKPVSWVTFWEENGGLWAIDQGDVNVDEATLRRVHLAPYLEALKAGALTVMASFSSWRGLKMHAHRYLMTDVLKEELGFEGFIVSDWMGIYQLSPDYYTCVVMGINAGIDMIMEPNNFKNFISTLTLAVERGDVSMSRIDDAVRRILTVKHRLGLFEHPITNPALLDTVGSNEHRAISRQAVRESLVLLKNEANTLPLQQDAPLFIAGQGADDMGLQCGGWTVTWQGGHGAVVEGKTLLSALKSALPQTTITYSPEGTFQQNIAKASVGIVVIAEEPYAEGCGDSANLSISPKDEAIINRMRPVCERLVLVIYSGRPVIITSVEPLCDAIVSAWLPGSEGDGIADVLCGAYPFNGKLSVNWLASMDQPRQNDGAPLYPIGYGLTS